MSVYRISNLIASTQSAFVLNGDRQTVVVDFQNDSNVESLLTRLCSDGLRSGSGLSLHFDDLRSNETLPPIDIYLNVENTPNEKNYVGSIGLYGSGQNRVFDVGQVFTKVCSQSNWSDKKFDLALIPNKPLPPGATLSVGRITLYYYEF